MDKINELYTIVEWPEVQELMEEDWFHEEAVLMVDYHMPSTYLVPLKRLYKEGVKSNNNNLEQL